MTNPVLPLARYRLHFRADGEVLLPYYAGSAWRGLMGHALKRLVCVTRLPRCEPCPLVHCCAHAYLFETPRPLETAKMRKYNSVPHPFVLTPPAGVERLAPGDPYVLGVNLFGQGNRHLPYLVHAFDQGGLTGIGKGRGRMQLVLTERELVPGQEDWWGLDKPGGPIENPVAEAPSIPHPPRDPVRVEILTPLRIRREGRPVRPESFRFVDLLSNLLRRVSMLTYFHTDHPLETDFAGLVRRADQVSPGEIQLEWRQWNRYSSRQRTHVAMDGLVGSFTLSHEEMGPFWPYLWLGQFTHAGAGTGMGQGQLRIQEPGPQGERPA